MPKLPWHFFLQFWHDLIKQTVKCLVIILHKKILMSPIGQQGFWSVFACRVYCAEIFWFLWFPHLRKCDYFFIKRSKICIVFFFTGFFVIVYPCNVSIAYSHISFHFGIMYSGFNNILLHESIQLLYIYRQFISFLLFQWLLNMTEYHFVKCIVV